ncbi:hypothetical protein [Micromonospora sp. DH14]|uniref:hypothetical protein n=1 Tax=Micromonospora sp. DH14 TaxID=3040120 RepID=UPI002440FB8D|nr:hypothetical protein [Micromonospora sp. DH14]MDG9678330.1 hypothetical protein [Micromonospora sp. DH14]
MLTSLLPGIRHLRAPLAAGYILLVAGWIGFGPWLRDQGAASPVIENLIVVGGWLDKAAILAAATFCAYLLGIISTTTNGLFRPDVEQHAYFREIGSMLEGGGEPTHWLWLKAHYTGPPTVVAPIVNAVTGVLDDQFKENDEYAAELRREFCRTYEAYQRSHPELTPVLPQDIPIMEHLAEQTTLRWILPSLDQQGFSNSRQVLEDLDPTAQRLIGVDQELYNEFDRVRSEAEFRLSLILPLTLLFAVTAWRSSQWLLLGLAVCFLLARIGRREYVHSYELLTQWILAGRIKSPALERARTEIVRPDVSIEGLYFIANNLFYEENANRLKRMRNWLRRKRFGPFRHYQLL